MLRINLKRARVEAGRHVGSHCNNLGKRWQWSIGNIEKWSVSGYPSKGDVYGLDVECERKRGVKVTSTIC